MRSLRTVFAIVTLGGGLALAGGPPQGSEPRPAEHTEPQIEYPQDPAPPSDACRAATSGSPKNQPPPLSRPANPWQAVKDGQPIPTPIVIKWARGAFVAGRATVTACDAQHDHCLRECSWLVELYGKAQPWFNDAATPTQQAFVGTFRPDETFEAARGHPKGLNSYDADDTFIAYRTVPAVKRLLKPGVRVFVPTSYETGEPEAPEHEGTALGSTWKGGVLRSVDEAKGVVFIKRSTTPWPLSLVRVGVLKLKKGGTAELMNGFGKDEIVIGPDDRLFVTK